MMIRTARSFLFVPGDRADRFDKAAASGADVVILDLEDAVAGERKQVARDAVSNWATNAVGDNKVRVVVRINAAGTPANADDVLCIAQLPASIGVMLAKSEPESMVESGLDRMGPRPMIALIETVAGVLGARAVAATPGVVRIAFGNIDFALDAGLVPADDEVELATARSMLVMESRHAGLPKPIDGVVQDTVDVDRIAEHAQRSRRMGFGAQMCIHPRQVEPVNLSFTPTPSEIDWARRVMTAFEASNGAVVALDGKMIDMPVVKIARQFLAVAKQWAQ